MNNKSQSNRATWADVLAYAHEQRGYLNGYLKGYKAGMAAAELESSRAMLIVTLRKFVGEPSQSILERIRHAGMDELDGWINRAFKAKGIDQVFFDS